MNPTPDPPPSTFTYETAPSDGVIEAVAWFNNVDPLALTPLHEAVDADALDALFEPPHDDDLSVSFEYDECAVQVNGDGTITVRDTPHPNQDVREPATSVLLLAPAESDRDDEACKQLVAAPSLAQRHVLGVTFDSSVTERAEVWKCAESTPVEVSFITVGDFTRSSTPAPDGQSLPSERVHVDAVSDPTDLRALGLRISDQLSAWESSDGQPVVCFHSLLPFSRRRHWTAHFAFSIF